MPGLGTRLRARWRALVDAARSHPRQAVDPSGVGIDSQHADTNAVDLRPRVRMRGPAGSEGPPPEWLDYVMAQDPVWIDGGLGPSSRAFDHAADHIPDPAPDVSTLTSGSDAGPVDQRPSAVAPPGRRPRARFVRPAPPADAVGPDVSTSEPGPVDHPRARAGALSTLPPSADTAAPARPTRRLLPWHEPVATDRSTASNVEPPRPLGPPTAAAHDDRPPVWPVPISSPGSRPTAASEPEPLAAAPASVLLDRTSHTSHLALSQPTSPPTVSGRSIARLTSPTPAQPPRRAAVPLAETHLREDVDPWASASSPAPVIELRRELDDRPVHTDPPVAVRWRALDIDRLRVEQRAL